MPTTGGEQDGVRVLRVIARLNVGGPAIQAITLTDRLSSRGYRTVLIRGTEAPHEGTMDQLAHQLGVAPVHVRTLQRELGPADLAALSQILRITLAFRPHIVHTHAAKAGMLGRVAAMLAGVPVTVHTFHGHVLEGYFSPRKAALFEGYFSPRKAALFRALERALARRTTRLVAVSDEVRADLVRLGVAPQEHIEVVRLGFDLRRFDLGEDEHAVRRRAFRRRYEIAQDAVVITLVARLVPIKRVDRFLRIARRVQQMSAPEDRIVFVIAGDGDLREELRQAAAALGLGGEVVWTGFAAEIDDVYAASEIVALTSDNEGTPVSLIEAHAASLPAVATDVGGVRSVVQESVSGHVVAPDDEETFARRLLALAKDADQRDAFGSAGRGYVTTHFTLDRLVGDIDGLYQRLLADRNALPGMRGGHRGRAGDPAPPLGSS